MSFDFSMENLLKARASLPTDPTVKDGETKKNPQEILAALGLVDLFSGKINAEALVGMTKDQFNEKIKSALELNSDDTLFYKNINDFGSEVFFDHFDKDKDGTITQEEVNLLSATDGEEGDISGDDLSAAFVNILEQEALDSPEAFMEENGLTPEAVNQEAMDNYTAPIGGNDYQNYGNQTPSGNTINPEGQFTTKQKLDSINAEDIPTLEKLKQDTIANADGYKATLQSELDELIQKATEQNQELKQKYDDAQKALTDKDTEIAGYDSEISTTQSEIYSQDAVISSLDGELSTLKTDTDDEEINKSNSARKTEIESKLGEARSKKIELEAKLTELQGKKTQAEAEKVELQKAVTDILTEIKDADPESKVAIEEKEKAIQQVEQDKATDVQEIDAKIAEKRTEALGYEKEIGENVGIASSATGSKVVQDALALAQQELAKGVKEKSGNNDGAEIDKYRNGSANGVPWCASFVSWIYGAGQHSDNKSTFGYDASVSGIRDDAINAGFYFKKGGQYVPKAGDVMIQKENGASHTGVITGVDPDGTIHTIEGNASNKVTERTYPPGSSGYNKISGYVDMESWIKKA